MSVLTLLNKVKRIEKMRRDLAPLDAPRPEARISSGGLDLRQYADDFPGFCRLLDIIGRDQRRQRFEFNPIQEAFQQARTGRDIILKARRMGFTTIELARDIWFFLTRPAAKVAIVTLSDKSDRTRNIVAGTARVMFESLRRHGVSFEFRTESVQTSWALTGSDSEFWILGAGASFETANNVGRGAEFHRLHLSELALYSYGDITLRALDECVGPRELGTEIVIESTANGADGPFYERFQRAKRGDSEFAAHFFPWHSLPSNAVALSEGEIVEPATERETEIVRRYDVTPEQLKWYRRKLQGSSQDNVDQENPSDEETAWLVPGRPFFDRDAVKRINAETAEPIAVEWGGLLRIWRRPEVGHHYIIGADPSEGMGGDNGAAVVLDRETGEHVATLHGQITTWIMGEKLAKLGWMYNTALVAVERNNPGTAVISSLEEGQHGPKGESYPNLFRDEKNDKAGWYTTESSRAVALSSIEDAVRKSEWATPDRMLTSEMLTFVVNDKGKAVAAASCHDDLVLATAIAHYLASQATTPIRAPKNPTGGRFAGFGRRGY